MQKAYENFNSFCSIHEELNYYYYSTYYLIDIYGIKSKNNPNGASLWFYKYDNSAKENYYTNGIYSSLKCPSF